jgi:predicted permease
MSNRANGHWWERRSSRRDRVKADIDDEIGYHFEECIEQLSAQGLSREDALKETERRFGNTTLYRRKLERIDRSPVAEAVSLGWGRVMGVVQDMKQGARVLFRHRSFTLVAVVTLTLAIGANTAIFSLVNSLLVRPLGVTEPDRLVTVFTSQLGGQLHGNTSYPDYLDYRDQNEVFSGLVAHAYAPMAITGSDVPDLVWGQLVSWDYFSVLGVEPRLGRAFLPEEDETFGAIAVTVLSHGTWQDRFGSDPDILGKTIRINDYPFTVIGVAPEDFNGLGSILEPALWSPLAMAEFALPWTPNIESRVDPWLQLAGRLMPGVTEQEAQASLDLLAANLTTTHPELNAGKGIVIEQLDAGRLGTPEATSGATNMATLLFCVVGFVLLVACFNVANLQLAKATARRREIALRFSLGASRWRIVRQLLAESLLLAAIAGVLGLVLAVFAVDAMQLLQMQAEVPMELFIGIDWRVLAFTLVVALSTGLLFGMAPAMQVLRSSQSDALDDQSFGTSQSRRTARLQTSLVVAQVALSLVLLTGAGLFIRSFRNTLAIDPGFDLRNGVILPVNLGFTQFDEAEGIELRERMLERVTSLPGVEAAALSSFLPLGMTHGHHDIVVEGYEPAPDEFMLVKRNMISAGYLEAMGIRLLGGRPIGTGDRADTEPVALVNEVMARRFWPGQDPVGRTVQADLGITYTVVGVIGNGKYGALHDAPEPYLAIPLGQGEYTQRINLVVKTAGDPRTMVEPLSAEVRRLAPNVPQSTVLTMPQYLDYSLGAARMPATLVGAFGLLALVLATVGLYGVMSYNVTQRKREFGVRMAVGATQSGIARMVLRGGLTTTLIGVAIGVVLATGLTQVLSGFLYNVHALDPIVLGLVSGLLLAVGQLASYLPARRASKTDPVVALRLE